ncbi:hypothetical protein CMU73_10865 [Elizabethkingia anophelis]|uniref:hypothetical protein n=1 Tax=Elizabethkingia anophelis TaxID=1117645 RepID=UPI000994980F|nr:hypothetical protein BBD31_11900 [Elizabethkingia anophelis]ASV78410.1 hypothetical protein A6J37_07135 [Elizabethkingia anophelis]MDV3551925.1 hypothetical protein [Elizabethkingia anophelis]MDV3571137.1 hypothetical protein [Elizabethkingia anophelis]MDV3622080.1 hypothetical protein [Elizabethkingia anophelis]
MWIIISILIAIAVISFLLMNSKDEDNQRTGAYVLGNIMPALVKIALVIGVVVLIVKACS